MAVGTEVKGQITVRNDARVTGAGNFLRRYKIDELPQLINVLSGEMSLVGPRPEVPRYVACYPQDIREIILSVAPGITDWAAIEYKDESKLLSLAGDSEKTYIEIILPRKLEYYVCYVEERSFLMDLRIIVLTLFAIVR